MGSVQPSPPQTPPPIPPSPGSPIRVPLVRVLFKSARRARLVAIYDDHIVMGVCRRNYSITERMLAVDGEAELTAQLRCARRLEFGDVSLIHIHPGRFFHYFKLKGHSGKRIQFSLLKEQSGHIAEFLRTKLADRVPFHRMRAARATGILVVLLGVVIGLAAMNFMSLDQRAWGALVGLLGLAVSVAGFWLLFGRGPAVTHSGDLPPVACHPPRHAVTSAKPPLRSKPLGWTLKLLGVLYWFVIMSPLTDSMRQWMDENLKNLQAQGYIWALLWFPAPLLIFTGYRLCQRRYVPKQGGDPRQPILFLRPFQDDEHTSLQPSGMTARATGIRSQSPLSRPGRTSVFDLLWSAHPMRVLRMIGDYGAGSSEESIARYFERHGPVIAIGKPGERLASPGAARMYLTDDTWQEAILCEMERAQAVVMQPAPSDGVRWELNHIREKVAPGKLLLCLVSYWNNPEFYEELGCVVSETLKVDLPRVVPYLKRPAFVYFDEGWNPHVQELSFKDPVMWPITSDGADLHYSLAGFVEGMQGGKTQPARPPRWVGGPKSWLASGAAVVLATVLLIVPNAVVVATGELIKLAGGGISIFSGEKGTAEAVARSPKTVLQGRVVAYQIEVPEALATIQPNNAAIEHWRSSPDNHFVVQIIAGNDQEDLSTLPQIRFKANSADSAGVTLDSQQQVQVNGVDWIEAKLTVTAQNGVKVAEIARGTSGPHGTVLLILHVIESPQSEEIYRKLAEECFQSFKFSDAAAN